MPTVAFQEHTHQAVESQTTISLFPFKSNRGVSRMPRSPWSVKALKRTLG